MSSFVNICLQTQHEVRTKLVNFLNKLWRRKSFLFIFSSKDRVLCIWFHWFFQHIIYQFVDLEPIDRRIRDMNLPLNKQVFLPKLFWSFECAWHICIVNLFSSSWIASSVILSGDFNCHPFYRALVMWNLKLCMKWIIISIIFRICN